MRPLPLKDPGTADHRSPNRYLWWLAKGQWQSMALGMFFGVIWMSSQAVIPAVLGRAIDRGVTARNTRQLLFWAGILVLIGLVQAGSGIMRHRFAVTNWLTAAYRTVQLVTRHTVELGGALPRKVSTGEVVAIGNNDLNPLGNVMDVSARFAGAVVSFILVAVILLESSVTLGLLVLIGVPLLTLAVGPLLSPLQRRSAQQRQLTSDLSNTASDIVGGLRVLRGIGGEQVFLDRYRRESQATRQAGVAVATIQSLLDALQVLLPGAFVVVVVWLGARYAVEGRITPGELVAFYGYSAFLMLPLRTATEYANKFIGARVAAQRVCSVLALRPDLVEPVDAEPSPHEGAQLVDLRSGLHIQPGTLIAVVCDQPGDSAHLADRLGLFAAEIDDDVQLGGVPLTSLPRAEVRRRIVVSDANATLFSGALRDRLDVTGHADIEAALTTSSAWDVLETLPEGLDSHVTERGRSLSGGQRQRLVLARVLAFDPEILVLVEPTSAVDAHTESRIADRIRSHRRGRTTVVMTTSPLMLDAVDSVAFMRDGSIVAVGSHAELLQTDDRYRAVVTREIRREAVRS